MKILTLVVVFAFFCANVFAQAKEEQEKKKEKVKFEVKTKEEIEREKAKEKKVYQPDVASFESRTTAISEDVLKKNVDYYQSIKAKLKENYRIIIDNIDLNRMSRVEIANESNIVTILHPINLYTARLSYYSAEGQLQWQRDIHFKSAGHDLSRTLLFHIISNNGKRVVVYAVRYESVSVVAVYDENGNELPNPGGYFHMAPSGNYFYESDPFYRSSSLGIYDANLSPLNFNISTFFQDKKSEYHYNYQYRIFENDIAVFRIREHTTEKDKNVKQKIRNNRKIDSDKLLVYDLEKREVIVEEELFINQNERYSIAFTDGRMDVKNNRFVCSRLDKDTRKIELLIIDLNTKSRQVFPIDNGMGLFSLSSDGSYLLIARSEKQAPLVATRRYSVLDLTTNHFIIENMQYDPKRNVRSFNINDRSIEFLFYSADDARISFAQFARYSHDGYLLEELTGWFNLKQRIAYLPLTDESNSSKVDILRINLGVVK